MWYLITFEQHDFIKVISSEGEVIQKSTGWDDGERSFHLSQKPKQFELKLLDDTPYGDTLTELNALNPNGFILLNHAAVLLKWDDLLPPLGNSLAKIFHKKDSYVAIPVTEIALSNFLPINELNAFFNSSNNQQNSPSAAPDTPLTRLNNKWKLGDVQFVLPELPDDFMVQDGIYYLRLVFDQSVGEEVTLIIYDTTDFIEELSRLKPFDFYCSGIAVETAHGPLLTLLFSVLDPNDTNSAFAIYDKPVDVSKPQLIEPWLQLAGQSHLHLLLAGKNHEIKGFFEFENNFGFESIAEIVKAIKPDITQEYSKAEQDYFDKYSLEYLYEVAMANRGSNR